ncbi:MAG: hypothetical protein HC888_01880 [Candidatus Competibacteraceae bacterium]|nr:hypothetical protein [Candidatus Competibacteraceae bacterium]
MEKLASQDGETLFLDGQRIGSQVSGDANVIKESKPAITDREAEINAFYRNTRLGLPHKPSMNIPTSEAIDEVVWKFAEELIDRELFGD